MRFTHTVLSILHIAPPKYFPVFISIDGEERLCKFLTILHLPRGILLWISFIFWNPLFQCSCFFCPRYCGKPHYLLSNEHSQQQRVFRGGGVSSTKSLARTDCSWQARNSTSIYQSDPTYSLMYHFATLCSNIAHGDSLSTFQPHQKMEATDRMVQI